MFHLLDRLNNTHNLARAKICASVSCSYVGVSLAGLCNAKTYSFWGGAPDPHGGAYSAPPYPLAGLVWVTTVQPDHSLYRGAGPAIPCPMFQSFFFIMVSAYFKICMDYLPQQSDSCVCECVYVYVCMCVCTCMVRVCVCECMGCV